MASQIEIVLKDLDTVTSRIVSKLTLDVTANLIETTPVDTGWARANWQPTIGVPSAILADPTTRDERAAAKGSASTMQAAGIAAVAGVYRLQQGSTFVTNRVPYIAKLNGGSSQQAPSGFVQAAIEKAIRIDIRGNV